MVYEPEQTTFRTIFKIAEIVLFMALIYAAFGKLSDYYLGTREQATVVFQNDDDNEIEVVYSNLTWLSCKDNLKTN